MSSSRRRPVDLARDLELALDGPLDLVDHLGAARPRFARMARSAHRRGGGAAAAGLCRADAMTAAPSCEPAGRSISRSWPASTCISVPTRASVRRSGRPPRRAPCERFEHFGYSVVQGRSDWVFGPDDRDIQDALFAGWAEVGALTMAMTAGEIARWLAPAARLSWRKAARSCVSVTSTFSPGRSARR